MKNMVKTVMAVAVLSLGVSYVGAQEFSTDVSAILSGMNDVKNDVISEPAGVKVTNAAGTYDNVLGPLDMAVRALQAQGIVDCGYYFSLTTYPARTKLIKIFSDAVGYDESDIDPGMFSMSSGASAVRAFAESLNREAKDAVAAMEGDPKYVFIAKSMKDVAVASQRLGTNRFVKIQLASHRIEEDGDMDYWILIAQEKDGTLRVLNYTHNPF